MSAFKQFNWYVKKKQKCVKINMRNTLELLH